MNRVQRSSKSSWLGSVLVAIDANSMFMHPWHTSALGQEQLSSLETLETQELPFCMHVAAHVACQLCPYFITDGLRPVFASGEQ